LLQRAWDLIDSKYLRNPELVFITLLKHIHDISTPYCALFKIGVQLAWLVSQCS